MVLIYALAHSPVQGLIFFLQCYQRIIGGLIVAIPATSNTALNSEHAPTLLVASPKIGDEGVFSGRQSIDSVLNDRPCSDNGSDAGTRYLVHREYHAHLDSNPKFNTRQGGLPHERVSAWF